MDMPKPGDAHKKLAAIIGEWAGGEKLHPSPWDPSGGTAAATVVNRWIVDGFAVSQDYEQRRNGRVTFRGHGVFRFDPSKQEYVMHWWDSMSGTCGEYRGSFDGDVLMLGAPMPQGGFSRTSWTLTGPDNHTFLMEVSPDGEMWHGAMEGRYRRGTPRKADLQAARRAARKAAPRRTKAVRKAVRKVVKKVVKKAVKKAGRKAAKKAKR